MTEERKKRIEERKLKVLKTLVDEETNRIDIDLVYTALKRKTLAMAEFMNDPREFDDEIDVSMSCAVLAMLFQVYSDLLEFRICKVDNASEYGEVANDAVRNS